MSQPTAERVATGDAGAAFIAASNVLARAQAAVSRVDATDDDRAEHAAALDAWRAARQRAREG